MQPPVSVAQSVSHLLVLLSVAFDPQPGQTQSIPAGTILTNRVRACTYPVNKIAHFVSIHCTCHTEGKIRQR